jgi:calcineurin-like phosphoesterase family protein
LVTFVDKNLIRFDSHKTTGGLDIGYRLVPFFNFTVMLFFTSDTHFGHANIIKYCNRPFANIKEHDDALVHNWNSVVQKGDVVWHLGDFGMGTNIAHMRKICARLNGQINFIRGNHDGQLKHFQDRFATVRDVAMVKGKLSSGDTVRIFLSHYPHRTWQHRPRNAYHLFGHVHGNMEPYGLSFDIGVDCWDYTPVSLERVHNHVMKKLMPSWLEEKEKWNKNNRVQVGKI